MALNLKQWTGGAAYDVTLPLSSLLADLAQMETLPAHLKDARKRFWRRWLIWLAVWVVLLVVSALLGPGGFLAVFFIGAAVLLVYAIVGAIRTPTSLPNEYRLTVYRSLLHATTTDMDPRSKVHSLLSLADSSIPQSTCALPKGKHGSMRIYKDQWMLVEGEFLDGVSWKFSVTQWRREKQWKNPRGKSKTKSKFLYLCELRMKYPSERYGDATLPEVLAERAVRLPGSGKSKDVRTGPKALMLRCRFTNTDTVVKACPAMFLSLYKILNGARLRKLQGARG